MVVLTFFTQIASFGLQLFLIKILSPEDFGIYSFLASSAIFFFLLSNIFNQTVFLKFQNENKIYETIFSINLYVGFVFMFFLSFFYLFFKDLKNLNDLHLIIFFFLCINFFLNNLNRVFEGYLQIKFEYAFIMKVNILSLLTVIITLILIKDLKLGVIMLLIRELLNTFLIFIFYSKKCFPTLIYKFDLKLLKKLLLFSINIFISELILILNHRFPIMIISFFGNFSAVGLFERARFFADSTEQVTNNVFNRIGYTIYSNNEYNQNDVKNILNNYLYIQSQLSCLIAILIFFNFSYFVTTFLGDKWIFIVDFISNLYLFVLFSGISSILEKYVLAKFKFIFYLNGLLIIFISIAISIVFSVQFDDWALVCLGLSFGALIKFLYLAFISKDIVKKIYEIFIPIISIFSADIIIKNYFLINTIGTYILYVIIQLLVILFYIVYFKKIYFLKKIITDILIRN